jgi:hypothetical protein
MIRPRSKESYSTEIEDYRSEALVVCPNCSCQAKCSREPSKVYTWTEAYKITCIHCGFNKIYETSRIPASLWLFTTCEGNILWFLNYQHLEMVKKHVEAFLRERNTVPNRNSSLGSRLPRWMTSKHNRRKVLKCIEKIQQQANG